MQCSQTCTDLSRWSKALPSFGTVSKDRRTCNQSSAARHFSRGPAYHGDVCAGQSGEQLALRLQATSAVTAVQGRRRFPCWSCAQRSFQRSAFQRSRRHHHCCYLGWSVKTSKIDSQKASTRQKCPKWCSRRAARAHKRFSHQCGGARRGRKLHR